VTFYYAIFAVTNSGLSGGSSRGLRMNVDGVGRTSPNIRIWGTIFVVPDGFAGRGLSGARMASHARSPTAEKISPSMAETKIRASGKDGSRPRTFVVLND
jgi:hypothetical protein